MSIETLTFDFKGTTPLLLADGRMADPLYPPAKAVKAATKRGATEDDIRHREDLKFQGLIYHDAKTGPYFPARNIFSFLRDSSVVCGKDVTKTSIQRGVVPQVAKLPILYRGPRDLEALAADPQFRYSFVVQMKQGTRVREILPQFEEWQIKDVRVQFDSTMIDPEAIKTLVDRGSQFIGIGTSRKWGYGRFEATLV